MADAQLLINRTIDVLTICFILILLESVVTLHTTELYRFYPMCMIFLN